jgi:outer membrane protein assembly factor BamB
VVSADRVYFGAWDGSAYALCASDGSLIWSASLGRQAYYSPYLTPAVSGNKLFTTTPYDAKAGGSLLYALDVSTGSVFWKAASKSTLMAPSASPGSPVTVADGSGGIRAFSQDDGALMWTKAGSSTLFAGSPGKGPLYVSGGSRGVLSFLSPEGRADYLARDSFLFVSPLIMVLPGDGRRTAVIVADTRGRLSALAFPR